MNAWPTLCGAQTKSGTRCKRWAQVPGGRCAQHSGQICGAMTSAGTPCQSWVPRGGRCQSHRVDPDRAWRVTHRPGCQHGDGWGVPLDDLHLDDHLHLGSFVCHACGIHSLWLLDFREA